MADTSRRLAGVAYLTIDGTSYPLVGEAKYSPSTFKRETKAGQDGIHGYSESPNAPYIEATIRDAHGVTVADFNAMTNSTVVLELANGKVVVGRNMWAVETQEVDTTEASFKVRFESPDVQEA